MEDVDAPPLANCSRDGSLVDVELTAERFGHSLHVRRCHRDHDIDVERRPRLTAQ
jgi:hypothetical protein